MLIRRGLENVDLQLVGVFVGIGRGERKIFRALVGHGGQHLQLKFLAFLVRDGDHVASEVLIHCVALPLFSSLLF